MDAFDRFCTDEFMASMGIKPFPNENYPDLQPEVLELLKVYVQNRRIDLEELHVQGENTEFDAEDYL